MIWQFSLLFSAMCAAIALKLCTWIYVNDLQINFKDGYTRPIFERVTPLELSHFKGFCSFPDFFAMCAAIALKLCTWTYKSSSKMDTITQFLEELCPLNLAILGGFIVFRTFFRSVYKYCIEILYMAKYQ
jgi:hypothetical protein